MLSYESKKGGLRVQVAKGSSLPARLDSAKRAGRQGFKWNN